MDQNPSSGKESNRRPLKSPPKVLLIAFAAVIFLGLMIAGGAIGNWFNGVVSANSTYCQPPEGYQFVTGRNATDASGNSVYILRGVIATGEGSVGGNKISIPPCGSQDPDVQVINNMLITLDGKQVILAAGSIIGRDISISPNPTQNPQP